MIMRPIRSLAPGEYWRYREHLRELPSDDRRRRFGLSIDDAGIERFVTALALRQTRIFAAADASGQVIAAVLIVVGGSRDAELAFSVSPAHRRRGYARALFERARLWARNRGVEAIHLACSADNRAIRRLAGRMGMQTRVDAGEAEATLALPPPTAASHWFEMVWDGLTAGQTAVARLAPVLPRPGSAAAGDLRPAIEPSGG
jgi:RimJ/RimL family protein N-acetyltransferase